MLGYGTLDYKDIKNNISLKTAAYTATTVAIGYLGARIVTYINPFAAICYLGTQLIIQSISSVFLKNLPNILGIAAALSWLISCSFTNNFYRDFAFIDGLLLSVSATITFMTIKTLVDTYLGKGFKESLQKHFTLN